MSYQNILVPVDGSELSFSAVRHAVELAKVFQSKLTLISIVAEDPFTDMDFKYYYTTGTVKELFIQAYQRAEHTLQDAAQIAIAAGVQVDTKVSKGIELSHCIVEIASKLSTDLIVMGSNGRKGFQKMILGNVTAEVMTSTQIPVLVVKS